MHNSKLPLSLQTIPQRLFSTLDHHPFIAFHHGRIVLPDLISHFKRPSQHRLPAFRFDQHVKEAPPMRRIRIDFCRRQGGPSRPPRSDPPRKFLAQPPTGRQPKFYVRVAKQDRTVAHQHVAGQRQLESPRDHEPVQRADNRDAYASHVVDRIVREVLRQIRGLGNGVGRIGQIGAGTERATGARKHDRCEVVILVDGAVPGCLESDFTEGVGEFLDDCGIETVEDRGAVNGYHYDVFSRFRKGEPANLDHLGGTSGRWGHCVIPDFKRQ
mmetsp:Transcript_3832/g.8036  ORF Transcript_3832/g.8036 Transcript_3832/m.8036 type:complete len:270 (-) Transcript_3832:26-835(-)